MLYFIMLLFLLFLKYPAAIAKKFNLTAELVIPVGIPSKVTKAEMKIHPVIWGLGL